MGVADGSQTCEHALSCPTQIIAKATEHLRVRVIPFWKAKNTLYHPPDET